MLSIFDAIWEGQTTVITPPIQEGKGVVGINIGEE